MRVIRLTLAIALLATGPVDAKPYDYYSWDSNAWPPPQLPEVPAPAPVIAPDPGQPATAIDWSSLLGSVVSQPNTFLTPELLSSLNTNTANLAPAVPANPDSPPVNYEGLMNVLQSLPQSNQGSETPPLSQILGMPLDSNLENALNQVSNLSPDVQNILVNGSKKEVNDLVAQNYDQIKDVVQTLSPSLQQALGNADLTTILNALPAAQSLLPTVIKQQQSQKQQQQSQKAPQKPPAKKPPPPAVASQGTPAKGNPPAAAAGATNGKTNTVSKSPVSTASKQPVTTTAKTPAKASGKPPVQAPGKVPAKGAAKDPVVASVPPAKKPTPGKQNQTPAKQPVKKGR